MPYVINGHIRYGEIKLDMESVDYKDEALLALSAQLQFPDVRPSELMSFTRSEFEWGRRYWIIKNVRHSLTEAPDFFANDKVLVDGQPPEWFTSNLAVPEGELPTRLGRNVVSDDFKELLEELEPDKHRFAPRDYRLPDGVTPWPVQYWDWLCLNHVHCIVPDIGDEDPLRSRGLFWMMDKQKIADQRFGFNEPPFVELGDAARLLGPQFEPVLSAESITGVHAWGESALGAYSGNKCTFLSSEIVERMRAENLLSGFFLKELKTSHLPAARDEGEGIYRG